MKIDRNNYEIYFLDYLEGRLTTDERAALLLFVDENPDLKVLLEGDELVGLVPDETIHFSPKSALKKKTVDTTESDYIKTPLSMDGGVDSVSEINEGNLEDLMIRFYDHDLNAEEISALSDFIKDSPTYIREFELFGNTLLKPDKSIVYPGKNKLKRRQLFLPGTRRIFAIVSVAASVLLFSTLFLKYINEPAQKEKSTSLAGNNNKKTATSGQASLAKNYASTGTGEKSRVNKPDQPSEKTNQSSTAEVRTPFEVPSSLIMKQTSLLADSHIKAPAVIARRTDFDGITSVAYYDPDPDALPLRAEGTTLGGRLGYTLANGISQTAGTIAREPELGRLLRGKVSLSDLASLGIAGFNLITDSKLSVSRRYDTDGNQQGYSIVDENKKLKP